jgi:hypothetical protein
LLAGLGLPLAAAPAASAQTAPPTTPAAGRVLPEGALASSRNVRLVANLPKNGAFASEGAFNSDLAFQGNYAYAGNYNGFTVYDIRNPRVRKQVVQLVCPGSQNDISVIGQPAVPVVDSRRTDDTCNSGAATPSSRRPASTGRASGSSTSRTPPSRSTSPPSRPTAARTPTRSCRATAARTSSSTSRRTGRREHRPLPAAARQDLVGPRAGPAPESAAVVATPVLFPDGGNPGRAASPAIPATETTPEVPAVTAYSATAGCHDITAYPAKGIAAGACMGEGVIMDITNPRNPRVVETVLDTENFAFWHSATFSNAADKVIFTDELGGGGAPTCNRVIGPNKGANAIYTLDAERNLALQSYYKIRREQSNTENCVAHNGSLIPVNGRDIMVQAWYQGGISVFDFTDPAQPA